MMHHEEELATACEILKPALKTMATLQSNVRWAGDAQDQWQPIDKCKISNFDRQTACDLGPRLCNAHAKSQPMQTEFRQCPTVWFPHGSPSLLYSWVCPQPQF